MIEREWPPGHRLFPEGGFHLAFDPPDGEPRAAILLTLDAQTNTGTILAIEAFANDADALHWFSAECAKRAAN